MNTTNALIETEYRLGAHNYKPLDVILSRGEGVYVWDLDGNRYLDCLSAYSAVNQGHCHPKILAAMIEQAQKLTLTSRAFRNDQLAHLYEELAALTGSHKILPMNSGAEAVETAVKAVRKWGYEVKGVPENKAEIIVCSNNFHGRTMGIVGFSTDPDARSGFGPFAPGFITVPFGDIDAIQTGLGRTGKLLAEEHEGIEADVTLIGKALSGGFYPVSAVLSNSEVLGVLKPGQHGSTFGGNPLACAIARAALKALTEEGMIENSARMGDRFQTGLKDVRSNIIKEVRGRGLMLAVELVPEAGGARRYCEALRERGILAKDTHGDTIRIAPPLVITEDQVDWAVEQFTGVLTAG
jgi:ornithine--oxo-acid transaminase